MKNKKGEEKLFSIWWFVILFLVGASVAYATASMTNGNKDIRIHEAGSLYIQIENCILSHNTLIPEIFNENFSLYEKCNLHEEILKESFYIEISLEENNREKILFSNGDTSLCKIALEDIETKNYPACEIFQERIFFYENETLKSGNLTILTGSNNNGKKIPNQ